MTAPKQRMVSIVAPIYNERENVSELLHTIVAAMKSADADYEIILVEDGSTDDSLKELIESRLEILKKEPELNIQIIELRRNFGQTAAIAAGFDKAIGEVIVPMDGDLQNDPTDIPKLLARLDEGYDVVSGWRRHRKDKLITRKIPSWIANSFIGWITGVKLHDYGCTLKAYSKETVEQMNLYGEMHRFIPAIASWSGARVTEMEVNHHPRLRGVTKYGLGRTFKVLLDLFTIKFLGTFSTRPLHIFGGIGIISLLISFITAAVLVYQKVVYDDSMNRNPLLILTSMFVIMSVQFLLMGLLAEMMCRTYHESQNKPTYMIRRIIGDDHQN